jgi:hypothetical protein
MPPYMGTQLPSGGTTANEESLKDDAFRPKPFIVRIEQGSFMIASAVGCNVKPGDSSYDQRSALRLLFDRSPYPPANEWKPVPWYPRQIIAVSPREFTGRIVDILKGTGRPMNHLPTAVCIVL